MVFAYNCGEGVAADAPPRYESSSNVRSESLWMQWRACHPKRGRPFPFHRSLGLPDARADPSGRLRACGSRRGHALTPGDDWDTGGNHFALMERSLANGGRSIFVNRLKKAPIVTEHAVFDQVINGSCD